MKTKLIHYASIFILFMTITSCQQNNTEKLTNNEPKVKIKACSKEARECTNGRTVSRNPANNCEFDSCDKQLNKVEPQICTADVKECPDGIFVGRDPYNKCEFKPCAPTNNGRKHSQ